MKETTKTAKSKLKANKAYEQKNKEKNNIGTNVVLLEVF